MKGPLPLRASEPGPSRAARLAAAALLAVALAAMTPTAAEEAASAVKKKSLEKIESEIEAARREREDLADKAAAAEVEADALRSERIAMTKAIQAQEETVTTLEVKISALRAEEAGKARRLDERRGQLATILAGLERFGQRPAVTLIARPASVPDAARTAMLLGHAIPALSSEARAISGEIAEVKTLRGAIETERLALKKETGTLAERRVRIDDLLGRKSEERGRLVEQAKDGEERMASLAAEAKDLRALIDKIEEYEARNAALERAARNAAERLGGAPPRPRTAAAAPARPFSTSRGALPLPVNGRIVRLFGQPDETGLPQKGVLVETRENAQVAAPHDGRIAFAGPFRHYGQLLIIAHGEGYHTLLAGMARIDVVVGQRILAGEPLGRMGADEIVESGANGYGQRLYVELRKKGEPINPLPWLAARDRKVSG